MKKLSLTLAISLATFMGHSTMANAASSSQTDFTTQNPAYHLDDKTVLGRLEHVYYTDIPELKGIPFAGKIDTGADTTSMHAENIHVYSENPKYKGLKDKPLMKAIIDEYGGSKSNWWLKSFDTPERNLQAFVEYELWHPYTGERVKLKRPLHRISVVRSRTSVEPLYRPVINAPLNIADLTVDTDVSLTARGHFSAPILIGKTFLKENAWVYAGYDYLQEQPDALVVGRQERATVFDMPMEVSFSTSSTYSNINAQNVKVNEKKNKVTFDLIDKDGNKETMSRPIVRMLSMGGEERPLIFMPVKMGDEFDEQMLMYLKDRTSSSTQLRIGANNLSQHFMMYSKDKYMLDGDDVEFQNFDKENVTTMISPEEVAELDGVEVLAVPSLGINTPVLRVQDFEISSANKGETATFYMPKDNDENKKVVKRVERKIRIGDKVRPIVTVDLKTRKGQSELEVALDRLSDGEFEPVLQMGRKMDKDGVVINTRTTNLLVPHDLIKAGYIEQAKVEGLDFPVKLDTGADVSSMNALDIKQYNQDGVDMVSFTYKNDKGDEQKFERRLVDTMTIRGKDGEEDNIRPVVMMDVQLGDIRETVRVNLQDRSRFEYSMILGKNFLRYGVVVSSDERYLLGK